MHGRAPELPSYGQADEGSHRQDEQNCGRDQRDRQDRTTYPSFARLPQWSSPSTCLWPLSSTPL
jgi:hypothetical protein